MISNGIDNAEKENDRMIGRNVFADDDASIVQGHRWQRSALPRKTRQSAI
jgi:hypothetical protein